MVYLRIICLLFIVFLMLTTGVQGFSITGKIVFLKGRGHVIKNIKKHPLKTGLKLFGKDIIQSYKNSTVVIRFNNGMTIKMRERSKITLTLLSTSPKKHVSKLHLNNGGIFVKLKKLKRKRHNLRVTTITSTAGVRGTHFFIHITNKKSVHIIVKTGNVHVIQHKTKKKVMVTKGKGIHVKHKKRMSKPQPHPLVTKLNWNMNHLKGKVEDKVKIREK